MVAVLEAKKRTDLRRSVSKQIRRDGGVPAVVYGKDVESEPVFVDRLALMKTIRDNGRNAIIKLDIEGEKKDVIVYELQRDTIKDEIIHADFYAVDMKSELDAEVPVVPVGDAVGVKKGGVLQLSLFEVTVRALPADLPEKLEVDVTDLDINDSLLVKDLKVDGNFEILNDPEEDVLSIVPPTDEPSEDEVLEDSVGEPEVIGKSDDEENEE